MLNRLILNKDFRNFICFASDSGSIIAKIIGDGGHKYISDEINYVMAEEDEIDVISFLPKSKYSKFVDDSTDVWVKYRVKMKIGKFVSKFLTNYSVRNWNIKCKDIEDFVNLYKSYYSVDITKIKVVSGEDIIKYYLEDNYYDPQGRRYGSLWNSCMRSLDRNSYMKLYANNENIKMLIYLTDNGKIKARALLWDNVKDHLSDKQYKFMDRIYTVFDHDVNLFKKWANDNGYLSKMEQTAKSGTYFSNVDGSSIKLKLYVTLNTDELEFYPFLDTFKFYNPEENRFSNSDDYEYKYKLTQTNGRLESEQPDIETRINDFVLNNQTQVFENITWYDLPNTEI